jgi:hypothetical protein
MMLENKCFDLAEIVGADSLVGCQKNDRIEPELALSVWSPDVDMGWFLAFIGVEVKSKGADTEDV